VIAIIRLILTVVLFAAALLTVVPAQTYFLWEASIAVNELGHWLAIIAVLLLLPGWKRGVGKASAILAAVSIILLLLPVLQASLVARNLPPRVTSAFGDVQPASLPGAGRLSHTGPEAGNRSSSTCIAAIAPCLHPHW